MVNFHQTASGFWYYLMWLFLDLVAAESMTTFIASVFPNFVVSLAITAFANGLWMAVGGFSAFKYFERVLVLYLLLD